MKRIILASMIILMMGFNTAANAHGGANHEKKGEAADVQVFAFGKPGDPGKVTRAIEVEMNDAMRFVPDQIRVKRGETIRFLVRNVGAKKHEMVIGSLKELKEHAELMEKFPEMEHADPNQVGVEPGKSGEMIWQFTKPGTFDFGCLQPGHFEAGMVGKIRVMR